MTEPIVQDGDPVLRQKAKPVALKDIQSPKIKRLIARMKKLLSQEAVGVGLAAPQVGESLRIFIVSGRAFLPGVAEPAEVPAKENPDVKPAPVQIPPDMVFINPEIIRKSRTKLEMSEGCLSVRGYYGTVMRHEKMTLRALDERGKPFTYHGSGLIAHIFQHETDHLEGTLYIDKAVKLQTEKEREELRKQFPPGEKTHHHGI